MRQIDADRLKCDVSQAMGNIIESELKDDILTASVLKTMVDSFLRIIDRTPTLSEGEDVTPVVHAHWVYGYTFPDGQYRKCSACKELIKVVPNDGNYCGHCGAKMDEEEKHETD